MAKNKKHDFTASAIVVHNKKVLLIHHKKLNLWMCPGGHVEPSEDPVEAVVREVLEETGHSVSVIGELDRELFTENAQPLPMPYSIMKQEVNDVVDGLHYHVDLIYRCRLLCESRKKDSEELELEWVAVNEISNYAMPSDLSTLVLRALSGT
jgi:8-oxo-dGTP diphosphatase